MSTKKLHYVLLICFFFSSTVLFAQEQKQSKTLIGSNSSIKAKDIGFFAAPMLGITRMDGVTAPMMHVRGGVSVKDKFSLGLYASSLLNDIVPQSEVLADKYMDYWTVGAFAEYTLLSKELVHITIPVFLGYGEVEMDRFNNFPMGDLGEANFFQIEPSVLLEVNLHKHVRLNAGAGYRFVSKMNYRNMNQNDISGFTGYAGIKIGLFK